MKKVLILVVIALFLVVFLLHNMGVIEFGVGHVIARLWALFPLGLGYYFLKSDDKRRNKSGLVLTIMGAFLLILNITVLFFENQDYIYSIFVMGTIAFWPIIILFIILKVILSLFERGETVYRSRFAVTSIDADLSKLDNTLIAQLGKLIVRINPDDLGIRAVRLDIIAFFGAVEVVVPAELSVLAETKTRFGFFNILGRKNKKILGQEVVETGDPSSTAPRLLLITKSWFGKVIVKHAGEELSL